MSLLDNLRSSRQALHAEAAAFVNDSETRGDTSPASETRWKKYSDDIDIYDARIAELELNERRQADASRMGARFGNIGIAAPPNSEEGALRSLLSGERRSLTVDLGQVRRTVNRDGSWSVDEKRVLTTGVSTAAGALIGKSFSSQLMEHLIATSAIRQTNATVFTTDNGDDLTIPKTTAHSTAALTAENAAISLSDPAVSSTVLNAFKYGVRIEVSSEMLLDSGVDLTGYLARQTGQALGNGSGAHFITGTGSGQPNGVATAATVGVTGAISVAGAFTADNVIDTYYSVLPAYRAAGYWLMNDQTAAACRKLKDTTNNYLWERALSAGQPAMLFGRPVVIDPNVANIGLNAKSILFGDFSRYVIRDVAGVRFEASTDFGFDRDVVSFRALLRTDGDLVDLTGAVKAFRGGAS